MICIARNRNVRTHSFFRVLGSNGDGLMPEKKLSRFINALVSAKGHKQLVSAIEECPCLLFQTNGGAGQSRRMLTAEECIEEIQANYVPTDAHKLAQEMYMLSPKELRANSSKESPAASFDVFSCDFIGFLRQQDPKMRIAVEPVQDWMTYRNFLTVVACLLANIENLSMGGRVLEAAGFFKAEQAGYNLPIFAIPLKFYAAFFAGSLAHPIKSAKLDNRNTDYLMRCFNDSLGYKVHKKNLLSEVASYPFAGDEEIFISTKYPVLADDIKTRDILVAPFEGDTNLYLCIAQREGESQLEMAKRFVSAFWVKTQNLVDLDGALLGMTQNMESLFDPAQDAISYSFHSLISQTFNKLCYHPGQKLIVCKHCGNGVLASKRGAAKEFCSDSCRAQYSVSSSEG